MKKLCLFTFLIAAGCGVEKSCTSVVSPTEVRIFGTAESFNCDGVLLRVTPKHVPGGEKISHFEVQCGKAETVCR